MSTSIARLPGGLVAWTETKPERPVGRMALICVAVAASGVRARR